MNPFLKIKNLSNVNRVVIGNLNINSLTDIFDQLKEVLLKHIDILVVIETKLDDTFPNSLFLVPGFSKPFCLENEYERSKLLTRHVLPSDNECMFLELSFRKCKWHLVGTYHPPSKNDHYFLIT